MYLFSSISTFTLYYLQSIPCFIAHGVIQPEGGSKAKL